MASSRTRDGNPGPQNWQADSYPLLHQGSPAFLLAISLEMEGGKEVTVLKPLKQGGLAVVGGHCRLFSFFCWEPQKTEVASQVVGCQWGFVRFPDLGNWSAECWG